jgi:predicted transcriptional regulator
MTTARILARDREQRAWTLAQEGQSQRAIAAVLEISQQAVSRILRRVEARELRELQASIERTKARQDARLEYIYGQAMAAWEESKKPRRKSPVAQDVHAGQRWR